MAEPPPEPGRRAPPLRGPFIMPDGRPLAMALEQSALRPPRGGAPPKHRPGRVREPKEGWTKPLPRAATAAAAAATSDAATAAEAAEMYALSRVGARKQRRWLNDKLLRDMAGTLTAADMASLFKPVPFGEARPSLWERAAAPEHAVLWDLFRSLEMDKQSRVLQKWEAHVRELQASPAAIRNPAVEAIAAWAQVSWKARQAMKRCSPGAVAAMEAPIVAYVQDECQGELVLDELEDGFHRLIAHGLAEYHSLSSHSRPLPGGGKAVVVRRRGGGAGGPSAAPAAGSGGGTSAAAAGGGGGAAGDADADALCDAAGGVRAIRCADICHLLEDERVPLTPAILSSAYLHSLDSASEAGDHPERHAAQPAPSVLLAAS